MARIFVDQSNYVMPPGESLPQEDIVDRDGYRDTKTMVEEFIYAGERLREWRKEEFDTMEDVKEADFEDPTKNVGFDIIDAQRRVDDLQAKLDADRVRIAAAKVEAEKAASSAAAEDKVE